jgi:hypothetical protein
MNYKFVKVSKSDKPKKKYYALFKNKENNKEKRVYFGSAGMSDFTLHKDNDRKLNYIKRHQKRENWTNTGILTPGWWSRWLLWNKPSYTESLKDVKTKLKNAGY